jgi:DNA processing protein
MHPETVFAHAYNTIEEIGPRRLLDLKEFFGSYEAAWHAPMSDVAHVLKDHACAHIVKEKRATINPKTEADILASAGIALVLKGEPAYPAKLYTIPTPPALLYIRGAMRVNEEEPALGVVGARMATAYGREACDALVSPVARRGVPIVSGLAAGIDAAAHRACLGQNGYTIAVVGSGLSLNALYPACNKHLAETIIQKGGAVLSEYPPFLKAAYWTFPQRNRIIAGLSTATLIIEARRKSGTRITAGFALEFGRDVLAVPGPIFSETSATPHELIRDGATPITSADDIFEALGLPRQKSTPANFYSSPEEQRILEQLSRPATANELARHSGQSIGITQQTLALLEIHGKVKNMGNSIYRKT